MAMAELQERINNQITYETDIEKNHVDLQHLRIKIRLLESNNADLQETKEQLELEKKERD